MAMLAFAPAQAEDASAAPVSAPGGENAPLQTKSDTAQATPSISTAPELPKTENPFAEEGGSPPEEARAPAKQVDNPPAVAPPPQQTPIPPVLQPATSTPVPPPQPPTPAQAEVKPEEQHVLKLPPNYREAPAPAAKAETPAKPAPQPAAAEAKKPAVAEIKVGVRVGEHPQFDRVVFDWPRTVPYKVAREGDRVVMRFASTGVVQLGVASQLSRASHFESAKDADGNLTVSFDVKPKAEIKDFFSGTSIAVDIVEATAPPKAAENKNEKSVATEAKPVEKEAAEKPKAEAAKPEPAKPEIKDVAKPEDKKTEAPKAEAPKTEAPKVDAPKAETPKAETPKAETPKAETPAKPAEPVKDKKPEPEPSKPTANPSDKSSEAKPSEKPAVTAEAPKPDAPAPQATTQAKTEEAKPADTPAPAQPAVVTQQVASPPAQAVVSADKPAPPKSNIVLGDNPLLVASLDPHIPLRTAVWQRGGQGFIVFDRKLTLSPEALSSGLPPAAVPLKSLDIPNASGFSFSVPENAELHANREGTVWKLYFTKQAPDVPVTATLVSQPDFALGARYLLPLPDAPDPVRFSDPVVGDDLILIPLNETQAFSVARRMADFQIWPAAQGLVIKPFSDKLIVRPVSDGIEVTMDGGLHLSPSAETGESQQSTQKARSAVAGKSIFDFATWRGKEDETFTKTRQKLQQTIVDVPERERNRARLELARFYFSRGYGAEALGLLNYLISQVPDLKLHKDFLGLTGAAKILSNRPEEGLKDLDAMNQPDQPEVKLWEAVGNAEMRNWIVAEDKFATSEALLAGYPEPFFSRFFVLAVESAVAVGNDREAADWLDAVQSAPHSAMIEPAIEYLHGVLHAKSGRAQAAMDAWKRVASSNDRLYKVRAELALIDLGVANKSLTAAQAADRLEALRFAWRGDDLEVDILNRLGAYYIQANNVKAGLAVLAQAVKFYPDSPIAPKITSEMSQTFHDVFLGDIGKRLSPLEALTLYQQYRDTLMPKGDDGIAVTRDLAERLAAVDLMEQAGNLLEDIARNKLTGVERGKVAARLAAVRLIDHKPQQALDALDLSANDFLPPNLQSERLLLRAKALSQMDKEEDALAVIKDDTRFPAKILRADINMRGQHWEAAAKNLLDLVGPPPRPGDTLRDDQADWLVRCAVAMAMTGDQTGLDKLAVDYGAAMAGTPKNNVFRVLVEPEHEGQTRDVAAAQSSLSDVDMFQGFLDNYRKTDEATDTAPPPTKQP